MVQALANGLHDVARRSSLEVSHRFGLDLLFWIEDQSGDFLQRALIARALPGQGAKGKEPDFPMGIIEGSD